MNSKNSTIVIALVVLLSCVSGCSYYPRVYMADEVYGTVVDAETDEPINDVLVLIYWQQWGGVFPAEGDVTQYLVFEETITDVNGNYSFSSWGPKLTVRGSIDDSNPFLIFHKRGYSPVLTHNIMPKANRPYVMESDITGEVIKLKPFKGSIKEYALELSGIDNNRIVTEDCYWEEVPRYAAEIVNLERYFKNYDVYTNFSTINNYASPECNDPKEVLREYMDE